MMHYYIVGEEKNNATRRSLLVSRIYTCMRDVLDFLLHFFHGFALFIFLSFFRNIRKFKEKILWKREKFKFQNSEG